MSKTKSKVDSEKLEEIYNLIKELSRKNDELASTKVGKSTAASAYTKKENHLGELKSGIEKRLIELTDNESEFENAKGAITINWFKDIPTLSIKKESTKFTITDQKKFIELFPKKTEVLDTDKFKAFMDDFVCEDGNVINQKTGEVLTGIVGETNRTVSLTSKG